MASRGGDEDWVTGMERITESRISRGGDEDWVPVNSERNDREDNLESVVNKDKVKSTDVFQKAGDFSNVTNNTGPIGEELIGLDLEERKRKRVGLSTEVMEVSKNTVIHSDSVLSNEDCADSNNILLATLARQAS